MYVVLSDFDDREDQLSEIEVAAEEEEEGGEEAEEEEMFESGIPEPYPVRGCMQLRAYHE